MGWQVIDTNTDEELNAQAFEAEVWFDSQRLPRKGAMAHVALVDAAKAIMTRFKLTPDRTAKLIAQSNWAQEAGFGWGRIKETVANTSHTLGGPHGKA